MKKISLIFLFAPFLIFSQSLNQNLNIGDSSGLTLQSVKDILDKSNDPKEGIYKYQEPGVDDSNDNGIAILKYNETDYISLNFSNNVDEFAYLNFDCEFVNMNAKVGLVDGILRPSNSINNINGNTYNAEFISNFITDNNEYYLAKWIYEFGDNYKRNIAVNNDNYAISSAYNNCDEDWIADIIEANTRGYKEIIFTKLYPSKNYKPISASKPGNNNPEIQNSKKNDWIGNGSGLIISKLGHIITNYHVIKDASVIEVEYKNDNGINTYNAEVSVVDEANDLAVLKIVDNKFTGLSETPNYNLDTDVKDIGNKVYTYGYPLALSVMGKEIKITDGIISSKTGINGDIKTYQITNPIQPGNSGGPMFDEDGNFIGVISSGLKKELADNVSYSIKSNYVVNLISSIPEKIEQPYSYTIRWLSTENQISRISEYVVLVKVK